MNRLIFKNLALIAIILLLSSSTLLASPKEGLITLEECLALAMDHHPALEEARAALAAQHAKMGQVRAGAALKGSLSASTSKNSGEDGSYSTSFSVSKLISDSGKTALERKSQSLSINSAEESQRDAVLTVRTGVKDAYYGLLLAGRKKDQAEAAVATYEKHLEKAKGFYEAGAKARFDVTKAEVDLSNARIDLVSALSGLETARAALSRAVGAPLDDAVPASDFLEPLTVPEEPLALEQALENRPDVRVSRLSAQSKRLAVSIAAKGDAASISVTGAAKLSGKGLPPDDDISVGLTLSVPVFDGGLTGYKVAEARESARGADASLEKLEQSVRYEVRSALLSVKEARERIAAADLLLRQAGENLGLAEGRYEMGVGGPLEVADGLLAFHTAEVKRFQALHDYSAAVASLEKTLGGEF